MDSPTGKSPRRELQGPRPPPLRVNRDSHKIKKPPVAPAPQNNHNHHHPRQPVIIYTISPKVIHTNPSEFMTLVQRLTGSTSTSVAYTDNTGPVSPAARFATIAKAKSPRGNKSQGGNMGSVEVMEMNERTSVFPGILSPGPNSLAPIPASFFSPQPDNNPINIFHDLSPSLHGNKNYMESSFMPSPNFLSPHFTSPTQSLDLFNNFLDFF